MAEFYSARGWEIPPLPWTNLSPPFSPLAVLTDGLVWWLYLPMAGGSWEQRRFFRTNLREQHSGDAAAAIYRFLNREGLIGGEALEEAKREFKSQERDRTNLREQSRTRRVAGGLAASARRSAGFIARSACRDSERDIGPCSRSGRNCRILAGGIGKRKCRRRVVCPDAAQ